MTLVQYYKGARILKAKRKPAWQKIGPGTSEGREAYKIAREYEGKFSRAFLTALRSMFSEEDDKNFEEAFATGSTQAMLNALPLSDDPESPAWKRFRAKLEAAYADVVQAAGKDGAKRMNRELGTEIGFTLEDEPKPEPVQVIKDRDDVKRAAAKMIVPINPYSKKWINERVLELIDQGLSAQQREVVAQTLIDAFSRGLRMEEVLREIKSNIGLTVREAKAVENRRRLLEERGFKREQVEAQAAKYREKLLRGRAERIARTETIAAQSAGRQAAWQTAQDAGMLPAVQRRWVSAGPSPNPNSPCEICLELDGKTAVLGEPYDSTFLGYVMHPGPESHPNCRCTEVLERIPDA